MADVASRFKRWFIHGVAITIPLVVTLIVLIVVLNFILDILSPVVDAVILVWPNELPVAVIQLATLLSLIAFFLLVGPIAEYTPDKHISDFVDEMMETIPVVSTVYMSVRRASAIPSTTRTSSRT